MAFVRSFEGFAPPPRFDSIPFVSVEIQESATRDGVYTTIATIPLVPTDANPADPAERDLTTANATIDPAWYTLIWVDSQSSTFASDPISSARRNLISVDELGDYLGRDLSEDDAAQMAVDMACDMVRNYAGQTFDQITGDQVTLDGTGTDALLLPELPVSAAGTVLVNGTAVGTADYRLNGHGALLVTSGTASWCWWSGTAAWPRGRQNITVTYDHGYAPDDLPNDVRLCALTVASRLIVQGVAKTETLDGEAVQYANASTDLTETERLLLRRRSNR